MTLMSLDTTLLLQLMRISEANLDLALTHRSIETLREKVMSPLSMEQAAYARDAFAKTIYERLFGWLVMRLNSSLQSKVNPLARHVTSCSVVLQK